MISQESLVVAEIMTPNPVAIGPDATLWEVVEKLTELEIRHLPIVEENRVVGMISDRDVRSSCMPLSQQISDPIGAQSELDRPVSTLMHGDVISVDAETSVAEVIDIMVREKIGALPVVEAGSDELVGIISYIDILKAARDKI